MSPWQVMLVAALWIAIGLATAVVLRKRGHEFGPNAALGAILGPVFVFLAFDAIRRREHDKPIEISASSTTRGRRVLIVAVGAIDDPASTLRAELESIGDVGPVTVAVPVEHEVAERVHRMDGSPPPSLNEVAEAFAQHAPGQIMLPGRIEEAIPIGVRETDADVVLLVGSGSTTAAPQLEDQLDVIVIRAVTKPDLSSS